MSYKSGNKQLKTTNKNILLAVTGSVAAIKSPEIAVRLVRRSKKVKVLLTAGGKNFWGKAEGYNPEYWNAMQEERRKGNIFIISKLTLLW